MSFRRPDRKRKTRHQPRRASFVRSSGLFSVGTTLERRRLMSIEPLETRTLLAASPVNINLSAETQGQTVTLGLDPTQTNLVVTVSPDASQDQTIPLANVSQVAVTGSKFNDSLTVDSTNGAVTVPISFDGGGGSDSLVLSGGTATSQVYAAGPSPGQGTETLVIGGNTESVQFTNLAPVYDSVPGPVTVTGTNGNDAITYTEGDDTTATPNPAWGQVSVNNEEVFNFTNKTTLTVNTGAGTDTVDLNNLHAPTGLTNITVNGTAGANDTLTVNGNKTTGYTPTGSASGNITTAGNPSVAFTNVASAAIVGDAAGDTLTLGNAGNLFAQFTAGATADSGSLTMQFGYSGPSATPLSFSNLGFSGGLSVPGGGFGSLDITGPAQASTFNLSSAGVVQIVKPLGAAPVTVPITTTDAAVRLIGHSGSDTFNVPGNQPFAFGLEVEGAPGNNTLNFTANSPNGTTVDLQAGAITEAGFGTVSFTGISNLNVNAGSVGGVTVADAAPNTNLAVTPTGAASASVQANGAGPVVNITNATAPGLTVSLPGGGNTLTIDGSAANDAILASNTAVNVGPDLAVGYTASQLASLAINGLAGNDALTVSSLSGAVVTPIVYDGGTGSNSLVLSGGTATSDVYTPGPNGGQGTDTLVIGGKTETVAFSNLTPVFDSVTGPSTVTGTSGNDAITYTEGNNPSNAPSTTWGQVSVNNQEAFNFINKTTLTINTGLGTDSVNLNNPNKPTGLTGITVNGGNSSAGDTLTVNGTAGNSINFTPMSATAATITGAGPVNISASGIGQTAIDGQGGNDALAIISPGSASPSQIDFTPGAALDSGSVTMQALFAGGPYMPVSFSNLGTFGSLTFANAVGTGADGLSIFGTSADNQFNLSTGGVVQIVNPASLIPLTLPIATPGVAQLSLIGQGGNDTFDVPGNQPFTSGIELQGNAGGNNTVNFTGDGTAPVTVDLAAGTVDEAGFQPFTLSGIGTVNVNGGGAGVTVVDANANTNLAITPTGPRAATVQANGSGPIVNISDANASGLTVSLPGRGNTLTIDGNTSKQFFDFTNTAINVFGGSPLVGALQVNYTASQLSGINVNAVNTSNELVVNSASGAVVTPITFAAGLGNNGLVVLEGGTAALDEFAPGPNAGQGSSSLVFGGVVESVAYSNVTEVLDQVSGPLTVESAANNSTFAAGESLVNPNVITVNSGPNLLMANKTGLELIGLGGDSTYNVTPSNLTFAGGSPFIHLFGNAGPNNTATLHGSSAADAINFAPTGANSGTVKVGTTATVSLFNMASLAINGLGGADTLTYTTPASASNGSVITLTPGATANSGSIDARESSIGGTGPMLMPVTYSDIDRTGALVFAHSGGGAVDYLTINGTGGNDVFNVIGGAISLTQSSAANALLLLATQTPGVNNVVLNGTNDAEATFNLTAPLPYPGTTTINASGTVDPPIVNLVGNGTAISVHAGSSPSVTGGGLGTVDLSGVGVVNLNAAGGTVSVDGAAPDSIAVTPTSATTASIQANGAAPVINATVTGAGTLTVDPGAGGNNTVTINGTANGDTIATALGTTTTVSVDSLLPINLVAADTQSLVLSGGAGDDNYTFSGAGGPANVTVVGGTGFFNTITLPTVAGGGTYTVAPGSDNLSGFAQSSSSPVIAFNGVHFVNITGAGGANADLVAIDGTSGSDVFSATPGGVGATTGTAQVNGGPLVSFTNLGSASTLLMGTVNAPGGSDTFSFAQPAAGAVPTVSVVGGTNSSATITDGNAGDAFTYTATSPNSGTVKDSAGTAYSLFGLANLAVVGASSNPLTTTLNVANPDAIVTPGTATGSGTVTASDTANSALLPLNYSNILSTSGATGTLVVGSTVANSTVTVAANGDVTVTNNQFGTNVYHAGTYSKLVLNVSGSNTQVTIDAGTDFAGGIQVFGTGTTALTVNATTSPVITDLALNQITGIVAGAISLKGVSNVSVNGVPGTNMTVSGYGAPTDITSLTLAGAKTIAIGTSGTLNTYDFTSESPTSAMLALASGGPTINITGFNNTPGNLTLAGSAVNGLDVIGSSGTNVFNASVAGAFTQVLQTTGGVWVPLDETGFKSLTIGGGNSDSLTVNSASGAVTTPLFFNGGSGSNTLVLSGGTATSDVYQAGPLPGSGTDTLVIGGNTETVSFTNLTPVFDSVAGPATVLGTSSNDTISYTEGNNPSNVPSTTWGQVSVNNQEAYNFANKTTLTINTGLGTDSVNLNNPHTPTGLTGITVNGGNPSAGDTLTVNGTTGSDSINFAPTSLTAATITGAGPVTISATGIGQTAINGQGGNDALAIISPGVSQFGFTPGAALDSGSVTMESLLGGGAYMPVSFSNLGTFASLAFADVSGNAVDGLNVFGTNSDNQFNLSTGGVVQIVNPVTLIPFTLPIATPGVAQLNLIGEGGSDTFDVPGNQPFPSGIGLQGTAGGHNTVNFTGDGTAPVTVDLAAGTVDEAGFQPYTLSGIGTVNVNARGAAVTVVDSNADTNLAVTPTGAAAATVQANGTSPVVNISGAAASGLTVNLTGGGSILSVDGATTGQTFTATNTSVTATGDLPLDYTASQLAALDINGTGGGNTLIVNSAAGAVTTPIVYDGGTGSNSLVLSGGTATSDTYTPGSLPGSGTDTLVIGGNTENVQFVNLTPVFDSVAGPLTVNGTNGDDAINYAEGNDTTGAANTAWGQVSVNSAEPINFTGKTDVSINALAGTDTINLNNTNVPAGLTGTIAVNGGPSGTDTLIAHSEGRNLVLEPTAQGAGTVTYFGGGFPTTPFTGIGHLSFVDTLNNPIGIDGTAGNDTFIYTPGVTPDTATINGTMNQGGGAAFPLVPVTLSGVQQSGTLVVNAFGQQGGTDSFVFNSTGQNDAISLSNGGVFGGVTLSDNATGQLFSNLNLANMGGGVTVNAQSGNASMTVDGNVPIPVTVNGNAAQNDALTFNGNGSAVTLDLAAGTITDGAGTVSFNSLKTLNVNAAGGTLTVNDANANASLAVTPSGANAASFQAYSGGTAQNGQGGTLASLTPIGPAVNATNVSGAAGGFTIGGTGGSDTLFVEGTQNADTIEVNDAASGANAVTVAGVLTVNYNAAMSHVEVDGLAGSDTINIAPSTTTSFLVDGGDPIGVQPGDTINLIHPPGPFQIFAGPTSDSGGLKTAGFQTVSWVHIETVGNTGGGAPIITGTNGNDEITVIARDSSYNPANPGVPNPLLDGVQDFTVSVNGGPDMLFINTPDLFIDSLSGNDDIVVREPAPNQAAWNVQVYVASGPPASGANRLGDNIELETPGTQSVTYTPNNPLAAVPPVAGVTFSSPGSGGGQFSDATDMSTITSTQFLIPGVYDSSPGGAENFIYAGEAGNDTLTYNTPASAAGSNLIYTPGATPDAGTISGSQIGGPLTPLTFSGLGTTGTVSFTTSNAGRTDHLNVEGVPTAAGESFSVTPANGGTVQLSQLPPASGIITLPILTSSVSSLELDGLGGNDLFNLAGGLPYTNTIIDDGAIVNLTGATGPVTVNLADTTTATNTTITGYGGTVTLTGVDVANLDAGTNPVSVNGSAANDNLAVTPTGTNSATAQDNGTGTVFNFSNTASFTTDLLGGTNTVVVNGTSGNDTIGVVRGAVTTTVTVNALLPVNVATANTTALTVATGLGTDTINVSGAGGTALTVLGGQTPASDTLHVTNTAGGTTTYTPGATNDSGTLVNGDGTINFGGIKLVNDTATGADTLNVLGTNGTDTITAAHVGTNNLAWVNAQAPIAFSGFGTLTLNGRFGNDSFVVSPVGLTGLTAINVTGNAGADNTVTVNGSTGADPITYSPTGAGTGTVAIAGSATVSLTNMASLAIDGQGGNDTLTVDGTAAGGDTFVHTPGAANDAGTMQVDSLLPVSYQKLGSGGSVAVNETGGGTNTLVVNGTPANDTFGVAGGTGTVTLNSRVPIAQTGIQDLELNGLSASDTFTLNATMPYTNVAVNGANIANNDAVVLDGATGAIGVNLANQSASPPTLTTITGYGGTVSLSNIAQASLNGSGADTLTLVGTPNDDQINYQPTSASGGNFSLAGLNTAFSFNIGSTPANTFTIFGGGNTGGDQVNVRGPNAGSTFIVVEQTGVVTVSNAAGTDLKPVILGTNVQTVELDAGVGNNTFLVDPAPGLLLPGATDVVGQPNFVVPNNLLVNIVGGGASSENALIVAAYNPANGQSSALDPSLFAVVNRTSNSQGVVRVFHSNGPAPANEPNQFPDISYTGVGIVSANTATNAATHQQQTLTKGPDLYEPNNSLNNAAYLGTGAAINASNLAIFPNAFEHKFLQADQEWFRVVAQSTGTLDFQIYFNQYAGFLPGNGELQVQVYDAAGHEITDFGVNNQTSDQRRLIPVVAGETYYLQVYGVSQDPTKFPQNPAAPDVFDPNNATINSYSISIINTPAPTPGALELNDVVAQGTVNNAIAPTPSTFAANNAPTPPPVIPPNFQTQPLPPLSSINGFYDGLYLEFTSGALIGQRELVSGYTAATHTFTFAAPFSTAPATGDTFQIESDDTGRSQLDNITRDNTPTIYIRLDAADTPTDGLMDLQGGGSTSQTPPANTPILIPFWAGNAATAPNSPANDGSYRIAVYDDTNTQSPVFLGYAIAVAGQQGVFQLPVTTPLSDGTHDLVAKVEIDSPSTPSNHNVGAGVSLSIVVDTQPPPVYFGSPTTPNSGLQGSSDTGVAGQPATMADRITADSTPTFYGVAEADSIISLYVQTPSGNVLIGQTTATPVNGTNQDPNGAWTITSNISLNNPSLGLPLDGVRNLFVTAQDVAGNVSAAQELTIFLDTQGPTVSKVSITGSPSFPLMATKLTPTTPPSPTPLVNSLDVTFNDLPVRVGPDFVYPAVNPLLAENPANYALVGENNGVIPITSVTFVDSTTSGTPGMSVATLHFAAPLPDDRYTLTISDNIEDNAGNPLSNGSGAGNVVVSFTVNSRAHLSNYSSGTVDLDINGDGVFDPKYPDANNRDAVVTMGYPSDRLFGGNFSNTYGLGTPGTGTANGFDKLAAYGEDSSGNYRFLYDLSGLSAGPFTSVAEPFAIDGLPVAGNFNGVAANGDQVGLFDGTAWYLDVLDQGYISAADIAAPATATHPAGKLVSDMAGLPFVGNFDGHLDLGTYQNGIMEFDLASLDPGGILTGQWNVKLNLNDLLPSSIPFNTVAAEPVAGLMDGLGQQASFGLWVPGRTDSDPGTAQWYFLNPSTKATVDTAALTVSSNIAGGVSALAGNSFLNLIHQFQDTPLGGSDTTYRFGDQFSLPLVGIWDPPTDTGSSTGPGGANSSSATTESNWITNLYQEILGREPSTTELSGWISQINQGMTPAQVAKSFVESTEHLTTVITGYYEQYLDRAPDQAGVNYWMGVWRAAGGPQEVQAGIISSPEYFATAGKLYPNLSPDAAWVTALYHDLLNRNVDPQGLSYWVNFIQTNSRASVVLGFVSSSEYDLNLINSWFETYLKRPVDASSGHSLVQMMQAGMSQDELLTTILSSDEYMNLS